jgi:hypothetical protein
VEVLPLLPELLLPELPNLYLLQNQPQARKQRDLLLFKESDFWTVD